MAEKRKLSAGFDPSPVVFKSPFSPEGSKSPFLSHDSHDFFAEQQRQNKSSSEGFGSPCFGILSDQQRQQNEPSGNKTINISPSFCFFGEQHTQNKSSLEGNKTPLTINISPSFCFFGEQQTQNKSSPEGNKTPFTINISPSFCFFGEQQTQNKEGSKTPFLVSNSQDFFSEQQRQNKPSPFGSPFGLLSEQQTQNKPSSPEGNKSPFMTNTSPSTFGFVGEQYRQNKSSPSSLFHTSPSLFGEEQRQNKPSGFNFPNPLLAEQQRQAAQYNSARREPLVSLGESIVKQTDFALSLAKHVISTEAKDTNFVFSPLSMHVVLSMVAAGSGGPTRAQFLDYLKSKSVKELNSLSSRIETLLFSDGGPLGGPLLSFANGVWVDKSLTLKPAFQEIVDKDYKAVSKHADFQNKADEERKEVNSWAEKETNGLIKDLLPPDSVNSGTKLILANALYFKGVWENKFVTSLTEYHAFFLSNGTNYVRVPFMSSRREQYVRAFDGFKVLRLPYGQGDDNRRFSMLIYLPDARDGLPALLDKFGLVPEFIQNHLPKWLERVGQFRVPKFKIDFGFEATQVLQGHGLVLPFSRGGLTEMVESGGKDLRITSFHHKSCIEVDEQGTEAAAASACVIGVSFGMSPPPEVDFVADHPFLFVVREDVSGGVLFVGQLLNPAA